MKMGKKKSVADAIICLLLVVPEAAWSSYVMTILWRWFIVPLGVKQIGVAWAYGIWVTVALFRMSASKKSNEDSMGPTQTLLAHAFGAAFFLLVGWIAHKFMIS